MEVNHTNRSGLAWDGVSKGETTEQQAEKEIKETDTGDLGRSDVSPAK